MSDDIPQKKIASAITKIINCPIESIVPDAELEILGIDSLKAINILFELSVVGRASRVLVLGEDEGT